MLLSFAISMVMDFYFLNPSENCYNISLSFLHLRVKNRPGHGLAGAWRVAAKRINFSGVQDISGLGH